MPRKSGMGDYSFIILALILLLSGCSSSGSNDQAEALAQERINIARALESDSLWYEAALEYSIVADIYPASRYYEESVRKAAILFSYAGRTVVSDSTLDRWYGLYDDLPLSDQERDILQSHLRLCGEIRSLRMTLEEQRAITDSIAGVTREQQLAIQAADKRAKELENNLERQLEETRRELEKLRDIDIKVGRDKSEDE